MFNEIHNVITTLHILVLLGEGNGNPLQHSCLGNPIDRGTWWASDSPWGLKRVRYNLVTEQPIGPVLNQ